METWKTLIVAGYAVALAAACEAPPDGDGSPVESGADVSEDCLAGGDEDGNGEADCADSACSSRFDCRGRMLPANGGLLRHRLVSEERGDILPLYMTTESGDIDGDGRLDILFPRNQYPEEGENSDVSVYGVDVVLSADIGPDPALIDVASLSLSAASPIGNPYDSYAPSATSLCDLNGDGFADLVFVDTVGNIFDPDPSSFAAASVSVVWGSAVLATPSRTLAPTTTPLGSLSGWFAQALCLGDIDGDARDDVIVRVSGDGGERTVLLDADRLNGAADLAGAARRIWPDLADRQRGPDLDGDGIREVVMVDQGPAREWQGRMLQRQGWILPGQASLLTPRDGVTSTEDEERPTIVIFVDFQAPNHASSRGLDFVDLDADGRQEMLVTFPPLPVPEGWSYAGLALHAFDTSRLGDLNEETVFEVEDIRASFILPYGEREPWMDDAVLGDIDGDGFPDLVLPLYRLWLAAGISPEWATGQEDHWDGFAVYFGDGTIEGFSRHWTEADAVVLSDAPRTGRVGALQVVDDVDGSGRPGLHYWGGVVPRSANVAETGFASAGFFTGEWLRSAGAQ